VHPNGLDHRESDAIRLSDELVEPESEHRASGAGQRRVPTAVSTPRDGVRVKRIAVGFDDDRVLEKQVDSPDSGEMHL
jgi:hypothetical protein